jgi:hypothetical protein
MGLNYGPATLYKFAIPSSYNTFGDISRCYYVHIRLRVIDGKNREKRDMPT